MLSVKTDNFDVYMTTAKSSPKMQHIKNDPRTCLYALKAEDMMNLKSIQVFGDLEIINNEDTKKNLWQDEWLMYYQEGVNDPEYAIIKVNAKKIMYSEGMDYAGIDI